MNKKSINLGFFGDDKNLVVSDWNDEMNENKTFESQEIVPTMFNYEITSNEFDENVNKVSKHCIVKDDIHVDGDPFFTKNFYFHSN
jgi:hypothetical protein